MTLGVLIGRLNHLRHVEGAIRAARADGHRVVLWCHTPTTRSTKDYERPVPARLPQRIFGMASVESVESLASLRVECAHEGVAALLSTIDLPAPLVTGLSAGATVAWLPPTVSDFMQAREPWKWAAIFSWSAVWSRIATWHREALGEFREALVLRHALPVGYPPAECLDAIEARDARATLGVATPRVVVLLPYPFDITPWAWATHVRYAHLARWNDRAVVRSLRAFCDRWDAALVVKERAKNAVRGYARDAADHVIEGDEPGEPTLLRLLSFAHLLVHFSSSSTLDAVAAGVRQYTFTLPGDTRLTGGWRAHEDFKAGRGLFHAWHGVARHLPVHYVRHGLDDTYPFREATWAQNTHVDPLIRRYYAERYLGGWPVPKSGALIVDELVRRVERSAAPRARIEAAA